MLRLTKTLNILTIEPLTLNYTNLQLVRWRRKPRWIPTAKSKLFKVPTRPQIPFDEDQEIRRLYNNYRTQIKSIRRYLTNRYFVGFLAKSDTEHQQKLFEEDLIQCNRINDEWNAKCKVIREKRMEEVLQNDIEIAKQRLKERMRINEVKLQEVEDIVRKEKEASSTFITEKDLDEAIERAIANPVDYNYFIDLKGNKHIGRDAVPEPQKEKVKQ